MVSVHHDVITLWSNDPIRVRWAGRHGVDRIGLDLERLGKQSRQRGLPTWISPHRMEDLALICREVGDAMLFVRCNPMNEDSRDEIARLTDADVKVLMLPNFTSPGEVEAFLRLTDGRAKVVPLVERTAALMCLKALSALGVNEVHVGLNDLSIELGLANRLVLLAREQLQAFAAKAHSLGMRFGLGGLGRALDTALPVPSDLVYAQHARLGASGALLARSFFTDEMDERGFALELAKLRERLAFWRAQPGDRLERARRDLMEFAGVST